MHFIIPPNVDPSVLSLTQSILAPTTLPPPATPSNVKWITPPSNTWSLDTPILTINLPPSSGLPTHFCWHRRGDYLASVCMSLRFLSDSLNLTTLSATGGAQGGVWIHQLTRRHSQAPFKKIKGAVQSVLFHPLKPHFFVAVSILTSSRYDTQINRLQTQQYVRIYNLSEQKLVKTLVPGIKWISSMDVHSSGDHLIVGGYDRKLCWFDLELSEKPYKVLRYGSIVLFKPYYH